METHGAFTKTKLFWNKAGFSEVALAEARGQSGGLWILKNNACNVVTTVLDVYHDTITIKLAIGNESWTLTGMYASPTYSKRLELWHHLSSLKDTITGPWMIIGDFNEIILPSEQKGGTFNQSRAEALNRTLNDCNLIDVSTKGATFTWA